MKRFESSTGDQSVYINRAHQWELGENESCWWIHLFGREGANMKLVYYSEAERDADLERVKAEIQEAREAVGEWEAWNNGDKMYHVSRLRDNREPFHSGNLEYAYRFYKDEPEWYDSLEEAQAVAERLNKLPKVML